MGGYKVWDGTERSLRPLQIYPADLCCAYKHQLAVQLLDQNNFKSQTSSSPPLALFFNLFLPLKSSCLPQDLKKYHFYYWFCFPALGFSEGIKLVRQPSVLEQVFSAKQVGATALFSA